MTNIATGPGEPAPGAQSAQAARRVLPGEGGGSAGRAPLKLQPELVRRGAGQFSAAGDDLLTALTRTRARLDRWGRPWGEDEPGEAFARSYLPGAEASIEAIGLLAGALSGIATTLHHMVDSTVEFDDATAAGLRTPGLRTPTQTPGSGQAHSPGR
jgi:hypothetical protein